MKNVLKVLFAVAFGFSLMCCKNATVPAPATVNRIEIEIDAMETEGYSLFDFLEWIPATVYYSDGTTSDTAYQADTVNGGWGAFGEVLVAVFADDDPSVYDLVSLLINDLRGLEFTIPEIPDLLLSFDSDSVLINGEDTDTPYSVVGCSVSFNVTDGFLIASNESFLDNIITTTGGVANDFELVNP